jgi:hypothetical protein
MWQVVLYNQSTWHSSTTRHSLKSHHRGELCTWSWRISLIRWNRSYLYLTPGDYLLHYATGDQWWLSSRLWPFHAHIHVWCTVCYSLRIICHFNKIQVFLKTISINRKACTARSMVIFCSNGWIYISLLILCWRCM